MAAAQERICRWRNRIDLQVDAWRAAVYVLDMHVWIITYLTFSQHMRHERPFTHTHSVLLYFVLHRKAIMLVLATLAPRPPSCRLDRR